MKTEVSEIANKIYRLSTFVPQIGPNGFTFNQFLIDADQPLMFHYGQRSLFPLISDAVKRVIPLDKLRWTTCSHVEVVSSEHSARYNIQDDRGAGAPGHRLRQIRLQR